MAALLGRRRLGDADPGVLAGSFSVAQPVALADSFCVAQPDALAESFCVAEPGALAVYFCVAISSSDVVSDAASHRRR